MWKLFKYFKKREIGLILLVFLFVVIQVWLDLKMPDYMATITKLVQVKGSTFKDILINGSYMLMCSFGSLISSVIVGFLTSNLAASFGLMLRKKVFDKVEDLSMHEIKQFSISSLITRTTNDITQVQMVIAMGLQLIIKAPITAIWAIRKILNKNISWSMITGVCVLVLLITISILMIILLPKFKIVQKLTDQLNRVTRENLTGIRVIRAFNAEVYQENKFNDANNDLTNLQLFNQRMMAIMHPMMHLIMYGLTLGIYFVGTFLIDKAVMSEKIVLFGDMVVFSSYSMQVIMSFLLLAMIFMALPRAQVSATRINEVIDAPLTIEEGNFAGITEEKGTLEFKNVSFRYPDAEEYMLKDISLEVKKGEVVAFIGSTGSGKSTLINLVPRFYDVTEGEILVDGVNVKEYKEEDLHKKIGYIAQKAILFAGTVKSNILYGNERKNKITDKEIKEALEVADAKDFVLKMADGYNSHVAQGGTNLSGGQKQRLCIARAVLRNPEIYIFDDSFSALDYKTDLKVRNALKEYTKDATCLIVAQRIGTIMNADKIVVLDNGVCVGIGSHKELLEKCKVYREIALSQLSEEELYNEK